MVDLIYILLFIISITTLVSNKLKYSVLLFFVFVTKGLSFLPDQGSIVKASYLAFFYVIIYCFLNYRKIIYIVKTNSTYKKIFSLLIFFIVSILFSIMYYNFPMGAFYYYRTKIFNFCSYIYIFIVNRN